MSQVSQLFKCKNVFPHFLFLVFPTGCVRVSSSAGDGLGGFRLHLTYVCSLMIFGHHVVFGRGSSACGIVGRPPARYLVIIFIGFSLPAGGFDIFEERFSMMDFLKPRAHTGCFLPRYAFRPESVVTLVGGFRFAEFGSQKVDGHQQFVYAQSNRSTRISLSAVRCL